MKDMLCSVTVRRPEWPRQRGGARQDEGEKCRKGLAPENLKALPSSPGDVGGRGGREAALPACSRPALLLAGAPGSGQNHLAPALLHALEALPVHAIGLPALLADSSSRRAAQNVAGLHL